MTTCVKKYKDIPFGHRQPKHKGHCALIHGHNMDVEFVFCAHHRDENGFVIDFGKLHFVEDFLRDEFDHRLLLDADDPHMAKFQELELAGLCQITSIKGGTSAENLAEHIFRALENSVYMDSGKRVWIHSVTVWEDSKNSATFNKS